MFKGGIGIKSWNATYKKLDAVMQYILGNY